MDISGIYFIGKKGYQQKRNGDEYGTKDNIIAICTHIKDDITNKYPNSQRIIELKYMTTNICIYV